MKLFTSFPQFLLKFRKEKLMSYLAVGAVSALVIQVSGFGIKYLAQVFLARWMGAYEFGVYSYSFSLARILTTFAALGLTTSVLRFVPQYLVNQEWGLIRGIIGYSRRSIFAVGLGLICLTTLVILHFDFQNKATLIIGLWLIPLIAFLNVQMEITRGLNKIFLAFVPSMIVRPLLGILFAFAFLLWTGNLTSEFSISADILSFLAVTLFQVWIISCIIPKGSKDSKIAYKSAEWIRVSLPLMVVTSSMVLSDQSGLVMLGLFVKPSEVGIFSAAAKTALLVSFILSAVNAVFAPMISSLHHKGDLVALQKITRIASAWIFWPSALISLFLIIFSNFVLSLFGNDFVAGRWILIILVLGQLVNAATGPVGFLLSLTGYHDLSAKVYAWTAAAGLLLNLALIPFLGTLGAALATMAIVITRNLWLYRLVVLKLNINSLFIVRSKFAQKESGI